MANDYYYRLVKRCAIHIVNCIETIVRIKIKHGTNLRFHSHKEDSSSFEILSDSDDWMTSFFVDWKAKHIKEIE